MIERICSIYPYPEIDVAKHDDENMVDETTALELCAEIAIDEDNIKCIRKRRVFKSVDNKVGYVITSSKMYPQGEKEKYWFGYREKRFEDVSDCEQQYIVFGCRNQNVSVIKFPKLFIESYLERLNTSIDDAGNVTHYHIVLFKNPDRKMTMLLSKPNLVEIDITEYLVGEA